MEVAELQAKLPITLEASAYQTTSDQQTGVL